MKKALSIIPVFLLITLQCAVAQIGTVKPGKEKISYSFLQHLGSTGSATMPDFSLLKLKSKAMRTKRHNGLSTTNNDVLNFSMLRSKASRMRGAREMFAAKFAPNEIKNKASKTNEISAFSFGTFNEPQDGGGIDIKLPGSTSLNLDLIGCYEGPGANADDSCGQSPDLDMSISFVFDLE